MLGFRQFVQEKIFDGNFYRKTTQDEALEVLQTFGKIVDSRKVFDHRLALRKGVFVLVKRPMTAVGSGYLIVQVMNDSGAESLPDKEVQGKVIRNYGGNDFTQGKSISISNIDAMAVSEDNKRFYIVYPRPTDSISGIPEPEPDKKDSKDSPDELMKKLASMKESIDEKYLSVDEIQDIIDSIKSKLEPRKDRDARGMLKLTKDIEKILKTKGRLHPNQVIAVQRIATGVSGSWGKNSPDWTGSAPSGKLNRFPPSPTDYIRGARR